MGELDGNTNIRDLARLYMGIGQGLALIGRVQYAPAVPRSIVNAALATLELRPWRFSPPTMRATSPEPNSSPTAE